ncbi:MAG: hypothetical protein V1781_02980 [Bacteroidota bacterium]
MIIPQQKSEKKSSAIHGATSHHQNGRTYQICSRCILDTNNAPEILFDELGVCNYCHSFDNMIIEYNFTNEERQNKLNEIVRKIQK